MDGGFVRHRGLIAFAAGGAMAESIMLSFLAPAESAIKPRCRKNAPGKPPPVCVAPALADFSLMRRRRPPWEATRVPAG